MSFTVGLTYDLDIEYPRRPDDPPDAARECDPPERIAAVCQALEASGCAVVPIGGVRALLRRPGRWPVDLVLNLAEGRRGRHREAEVPIVLEMFGVPYVGSDALTLSLALDKWMTKQLCRAAGVVVPRGFSVANVRRRAPWDALRYPVLVKPRWEGSGKGIDERSVAATPAAAKRRAAWVIETYRQPALVEEWIDGPEYTVACVGPSCEHPLPPVERQRERATGLACHLFSEEGYAAGLRTLLPTAALDESALDRLGETARTACQALECRDLTRVDLRLDRRGVPHVLEVNPLPSLAPDDTFGLLGEMLGVGLAGILAAIVEGAVARWRLHVPGWTAGVRLSRLLRHRVSLAER